MTHTVESFNKAIKGTQFEKDLGNPMNVNDAMTSKAYVNLLLTIRDVTIYSKGMCISRHWKFTPVKQYFGCKGKAVQVLEQLHAYRDYLKGVKAEA